MIKLRLSVWLILCASFSALTPLATLAQNAAETLIANPLKTEWAQDHSDIKPNPNVIFGRLSNGLGYAIYKIDRHINDASVYMRIGAGSMLEDDDQRGLAHFVEHMAFNGSENIDRGTLMPLLERNGMQLGPDAGAFTTAEKTQYILDLPKSDPLTIEKALFIFREMAGNLLFEPDAIEHERPVVLGEERRADSPQHHMSSYLYSQLFEGQKAATRLLPIGLTEVVAKAPRQRIVDFYNQFYRPDMTVIAIAGDIDPVRTEKMIREKFSDWQPKNTTIKVDFGTYTPKGLRSAVYKEAGLTDNILINYNQPYDDRFQTLAYKAQALPLDLLRSVFNKRLSQMAENSQSNFVGAALSDSNLYHTNRLITVSVNPKPGKDKEALIEVTHAIKQFMAYGIHQDELDEALINTEAAHKNIIASEKTFTPSLLARSVIANIDINDVFTSADQDMEIFQKIKPDLTLDKVNALRSNLFSGDGPFLFHSGEAPETLDAEALKANYISAMNDQVADSARVAVKPWPYTDFGPSQPPVETRQIKDPEFTRYRFANGVILNVKQTKSAEDTIWINVDYDGGLRRLSPQTPMPINELSLFAATGMLYKSGTKQISYDDLSKSLAGKLVGLNYSLSDDRASLSYKTNKNGFATQMQIFMAYATEPGFRPEDFERLKSIMPSVFTTLKTNPSVNFQIGLQKSLHPNDRRYAMDDLTDFTKVTNDALKSAYDFTISDTPVTITIVGTITPQDAALQVSKTFALLPKRPSFVKLFPGNEVYTQFPTDNLTQTVYHQGRADQGVTGIVWHLPDYLSNTKTSRGLEVLTTILNQRVFDVVRQQDGLAYDPTVVREQSLHVKNLGQLMIYGSVKVGNESRFKSAIIDIINDLKSHPISKDEIERAQKPLLETFEHNEGTNVYWLTLLPEIDEDRPKSHYSMSYEAEIKAVTPEDIQALAKLYLDESKALKIQVIPETKK